MDIDLQNLTEPQRRLHDVLRDNLPPLVRLPDLAAADISDPAVAARVDHFALMLSSLPSFNGKTIPAAGICFAEAHRLRGQVAIGATSGNTGVGFGLLKSTFGLREFVAVVDAAVPEGKRDQLKLAGATIAEPIEGLTAIETAHAIAEREGYVELDQYHHPGSVEGHLIFTMPHLEMELARLKIRRCYLAVALGTTSLAVAASRYFRKRNPEIRVLGIHSSSEAERVPGTRSLNGLRDTGFGFAQEIAPEHILEGVSKKQAAHMSHRLYHNLVPAGWSSGLVVATVNRWLELQYKAGPPEAADPAGRTAVVSIFIDGPLPYAAEMHRALLA